VKVLDHLPKFHMEILLRYFNAKVSIENIFKPTIGNGSRHQENNYNRFRIVNFDT
jgi:hypothetical protein